MEIKLASNFLDGKLWAVAGEGFRGFSSEDLAKIKNEILKIFGETYQAIFDLLKDTSGRPWSEIQEGIAAVIKQRNFLVSDSIKNLDELNEFILGLERTLKDLVKAVEDEGDITMAREAVPVEASKKLAFHSRDFGPKERQELEKYLYRWDKSEMEAWMNDEVPQSVLPWEKDRWPEVSDPKKEELVNVILGLPNAQLHRLHLDLMNQFDPGKLWNYVTGVEFPALLEQGYDEFEAFTILENEYSGEIFWNANKAALELSLAGYFKEFERGEVPENILKALEKRITNPERWSDEESTFKGGSRRPFA